MRSKALVRSDMKRVLSNLDRRWIRAASSLLCIHLEDLIANGLPHPIEHILAWTSHFPGEPDLTAFISSHLGRYQISLPRTLEDGSMRFISIGGDWSQVVSPGRYGIPEPLNDEGIPYTSAHAEETVVLVPGLAFDAHGDRLGRGKGFYDRFLGRAKMRGALTVGVGWTLQMLDDVPSEAHDVPMDFVCHERGWLRCERRR